MTARGEPGRGVGGDPSVHVEPVGAPVERDPGLVQPGLGGHGPDRFGRDVRGVDDEHVDPSSQLVGEGVVQVALMDLSMKVPARAAHGRGVDVSGVQVDAGTGCAQHRPERTRAAAQVHDRRVLRCDLHGGGREELRTPAGHEHRGLDEDPQAAELGPAEDLLEREPRDPARDHVVELGGGGRGGDDQVCLVLGEHAACGAEGEHDVRRGHGETHATTRWAGRAGG
ncbi:hypothetical protein D3C74_346880 [compost metagenome]